MSDGTIDSLKKQKRDLEGDLDRTQESIRQNNLKLNRLESKRNQGDRSYAPRLNSSLRQLFKNKLKLEVHYENSRNRLAAIRASINERISKLQKKV